MKKFFPPFFLLLMVLFAGTAYSQGLRNEIKVYRPDFSGTWKYNPVRPGVPEARGSSDSSLLMIVEQKLPAIFVTAVVKEEDKDSTLGTKTFYTDGRGDEFSGLFESNHSTTQWQGNKLVITIFSSGKIPKEVTNITELELSPDGNTLTARRKTTRMGRNPNGERTRSIDDTNVETAVFDRVVYTPVGSKADHEEN